jgi:hypothetical protein
MRMAKMLIGVHTMSRNGVVVRVAYVCEST